MATLDPRNDTTQTTNAMKDMANGLLENASPVLRDAYEQVSTVASDLYESANAWLGREDNRNKLLAMIAAAGVVGYLLGRRVKSGESDF